MKYALVTGGSRGLGRAICLKLAEMGIPVVINYQSSEQAAQEVKSACEALGVQAELLKFNVGDISAVDAAIDQWEEAHPEDYIAYLINNAGITRDNMMFMMPESAVSIAAVTLVLTDIACIALAVILSVSYIKSVRALRKSEADNKKTRFSRLMALDEKYAENKAKSSELPFNDRIALREFCDGFRSFAASSLKLYYCRQSTS